MKGKRVYETHPDLGVAGLVLLGAGVMGWTPVGEDMARRSLWMTRRALAEPGLSANVRPAVQMPGSRSVMMILRALLAVPR